MMDGPGREESSLPMGQTPKCSHQSVLKFNLRKTSSTSSSSRHFHLQGLPIAACSQVVPPSGCLDVTAPRHQLHLHPQSLSASHQDGETQTNQPRSTMLSLGLWLSTYYYCRADFAPTALCFMSLASPNKEPN